LPQAIDSKPSRHPVPRAKTSSGEWRAAPDAPPQSLELFLGHHGIDPLDPSGRPDDGPLGQLHTLSIDAGAAARLSNGAAAGTRPPVFCARHHSDP